VDLISFDNFRENDKMKGIIIPFTEEEFDERMDAAIQRALVKYLQKSEDIEYLTRKETSQRLHISLPTLNEYTKSGKLPAYRINGRVLYRKDDIDSALTAVRPLKYRR
jgi:excisionase family DNA binding protein